MVRLTIWNGLRYQFFWFSVPTGLSVHCLSDFENFSIAGLKKYSHIHLTSGKASKMLVFVVCRLVAWILFVILVSFVGFFGVLFFCVFSSKQLNVKAATYFVSFVFLSLLCSGYIYIYVCVFMSSWSRCPVDTLWTSLFSVDWLNWLLVLRI